MMAKYVPADYSLLPLNDENVEKTAVVRIVVESMSGKANRLSPVHTVIPDRK